MLGTEQRTHRDQEIWEKIKSVDGSWEEKHTKIMETLKKEVKFIESLMRQSELLTADEENFAEKIENIWEKALNYFDPEIVEASKRFIQIEKEKDELTEKQRSISDDYFSSETSEDTKAKIEEMEEQLEALEEEYNDTSDPAGKLKFISKTRRLVDSCIKKHEEIERIQNNKETILAAFQEILTESRNFDKTKIIRIEKSAFSITIVFTEDEYDRLFHDKSNGRHFPNTPFNAIKERATPEEEAGTINHENIHNLTEESIATENPERLFNHRLIRYKKNKKESMDEDSEILQSSLKILTNEQSYLDELHGEIIAAFEQAEETDFYDDSFEGSKYFSDFEKIAYSLHTAGNQTIRLDNAFKLTIRENHEDQNLVNALKILRRRFRNGFLQIVEQMRDYSKIADRINEGARAEVETLLFILPPSKYRHIEAYMTEYYDKEVIIEYKTIRNLSEFYTIDQLKDGVNLLLQKPELLTPELKEKIIKNAKDREGNFISYTEQIGIKNLEGKREYTELLKKLANLFGNENLFEYLIEHVEYSFMDAHITSDAVNEFVNLPTFYNTLDEGEKEAFYRALSIYVDNSFEIDFMPAKLSDIKDRPMWKIFESLSLTEKLMKDIPGLK